ncbi:uncharacterized protein (DUF1697 family) [Mesorhizobium soli]|uniref:DUF1697 domain-containing protein n=1 Tax=Pseudaminobacter soli (ex Li et al. 2025) TaxID=1295366 RepID=UPI00247559D7|nr:DUF1697 domain-containing protein [Mesorhizobium soli]MDH6232875.1 uncharacterized protein (DUF1697 family) [Mesorhizobium soli]
MRTFIALFRGINVGGINIIKMAELKALFGELGFTSSQTYVQSGNVVFRAPEAGNDSLAMTIGEAVKARFGFAPHIIVRDTAEWSEIIVANPFPDFNLPKNLHAYILDTEPGAASIDELAGKERVAGEYAIKGRVLYLYTPEGLLKSNLPALLERTLRVPMTARNWNTVLALQSLAAAAAEN